MPQVDGPNADEPKRRTLISQALVDVGKSRSTHGEVETEQSRCESPSTCFANARQRALATKRGRNARIIGGFIVGC